jgi:hypothetical protein
MKVYQNQKSPFPGYFKWLRVPRSKVTFFRVQSHLFPGSSPPKVTFFPVFGHFFPGNILPKGHLSPEGSGFQGTKGHLFPGSSPSGASKVTFFRVSKQAPRADEFL